MEEKLTILISAVVTGACLIFVALIMISMRLKDISDSLEVIASPPQIEVSNAEGL